MTASGKQVINTLLDAYIVERIASLASYLGITKTRCLTMILDSYFATLDNNIMDPELIDYLLKRDDQFLQENPNYTRKQYLKLSELCNNGTGRLYERLKAREEQTAQHT